MELSGGIPDWIGAAIAVAGFVWATIGRPLLRLRDDIRQLHEEDNEKTRMIQEIRTELKTNGGSSLRDSVTRIEQGTNEVKTRLDEHIRFHLEEGRGR